LRSYKQAFIRATVALVVLSLGACGIATPVPTPMPTPQIPSGWSWYSAEKFQVALPPDWIGLELAPGAFDALVAKAKTSNPQWVPALAGGRAAKYSPEFKFWGADPSAPLNAVANLVVGHEPTKTGSAEEYAQRAKQRLGVEGAALTIGERTRQGLNDVLRFQVAGSAPSSVGVHDFVQQIAIIDHGADRYFIILAHSPRSSQQYSQTFDGIVGSFYVGQ